ncbi:MAG TPA: sigma-70 family RNA polymerase sigma factor [Sandaracinaceae bacterium]
MRTVGESYDEHRAALFGLCYRMTGSAADAEDLVQETFSRALERPPTDRSAPLRPWLMKVAVNLCIDALRKRKRERYFGPWLPAPVETERLIEGFEPSPEARFDRMESASAAFLLALEALDPRQRAVLVLRDVLGLSGAETAELLSISHDNVRVILHRARKALASYEASRNPPTEEVRVRTAAVLRRLMGAFAAGDYDALRDMLAEDARCTHDAGGDYAAAVRVVRGRDAIVELYRNLMRVTAMPTWVEERDYNGLPALALLRPVKGPRHASRLVIQIELDREGRIAHMTSVLARRKLTAVEFPASA